MMTLPTKLVRLIHSMRDHSRQLDMENRYLSLMRLATQFQLLTDLTIRQPRQFAMNVNDSIPKRRGITTR
ncbi:hypothetical protein C476_15428 [Natrinema limicola JCM 13563]|uniref:Uncharacterized protein n=1 Tax=Natrinema limicola JCM 13563 TaxID=1230457 RepID=M0C2M0_9EURY|nr:hypothetical protein C476_15428 [Natrinema limicola JCM 13563]